MARRSVKRPAVRVRWELEEYTLALGAALDGCGVFESPMIGLTLGPLWGMALSTLGASGKSAPKNEKHIKSGGTTPCNAKKN